MPSGTQIIAAAGNQISVLDLVAAKPLKLIKNHQKTVTSLCLATNSTRLISGGLDGHVKVFETSGWNVVSGSKFASPVLSVNVIPGGKLGQEDKHLAVGMESGVLTIKTRLTGAQKSKEKKKEAEMQALIDGNLDQFDKKNKKRARGIDKKLRGMDFVGEGADVIIEGNEVSCPEISEVDYKVSILWFHDLQFNLESLGMRNGLADFKPTEETQARGIMGA